MASIPESIDTARVAVELVDDIQITYPVTVPI